MSISVQVLGGWTLTRNDAHPATARVAVQHLVAFLALRGRVQQRALVAGSLWPESSERRAGANLRSTLWHARTQTPGLVEGDASRVWLCDAVRTDYDAAGELVRRVLLGLSGPDERWELLDVDVLPDWDDDWIVPVRFVHRQLRLLALERVGRDADVTSSS